jgi:hypothetical protein
MERNLIAHCLVVIEAHVNEAYLKNACYPYKNSDNSETNYKMVVSKTVSNNYKMVVSQTIFLS